MILKGPNEHGDQYLPAIDVNRHLVIGLHASLVLELCFEMRNTSAS